MLFAHVATHTIHAGVMGIICGSMHALGPDHLATLAAFSTLLEPWAAARVGVYWGLGHCAGVAGVALLVFLAGRIPWLHIDSWERNGDYVIGFSMIVVAVYFIVREEQYVQLDNRGQLVVKGCSCHSEPHVLEEARKASQHEEAHEASSEHSHGSGKSQAGGSPKFCSSFGSDACGDDCHHHHSAEETTPLIAHKADATQGRDLKGALVGMIQGMCCPMGLIQLGYLAGRNAADTVVFIIVTIAVSVCGTASAAAAWAALTRSGLGNTISPRFMYRISCGLAFMLGIVWISANYLDVLDKVNYAEHGSAEGISGGMPLR
mmetsp:Transcript_16179/g.33429  ORF Transcript_16179/g.33429 Transcript_16179/m.33429 type:complete len:319 (+) Transcript_16179:108-1064(+)